MAFLAIAFTLAPHFFKVVGVFLWFLVLSCLYAIIKGETWSISIQDGVLSWSYPRWPKSAGRIELSSVRHLVVDDASDWLRFTFRNGKTQPVQLWAPGRQLHDFVQANFPTITLEHIEDAGG